MSQTYFCYNCGKIVPKGAQFCSSCGAPISSEPGNAPIQPLTQNSQQQNVKRNSRRISIPAVILGILLLLFGLRIPILGLFGTSTSAVVTDTRQIVDSTSDKMDYNYSITYSYTDQNGKDHTSSYQMNKVYNSSSLPGINSTISVKYLPAVPFISVTSAQSNGIGALILMGLGLLLIILGFSGKVSISMRHR